MSSLHYLTQPCGRLKTSHAATMRALHRLGATVQRVPGERAWLATLSSQDCEFISANESVSEVKQNEFTEENTNRAELARR